MSPFPVRRLALPGAVVLVLTGVVLSGAVGHAQPTTKLAERLAGLRAEVEELSEQLTRAKTDTRNELLSLARQNSDLQVELDRETIRVSKLRSALNKQTVKLAETTEQGKDLQPVYDAGRAAMRRYVEASLPFRRGERLAELDKIHEQLQTGVLTYPRALTRLWSFIEDEFRMTRESAAFQQTIELHVDETLAGVVRIGMVMMLFQTSDGTVGYTQKTGDGWTFVTAANASQRNHIRTLFDSFKHQIRVGLFYVPNALPAVTESNR